MKPSSEPSNKQKIKIQFTDLWFEETEENIKNWSLYRLLSKRYDLELSDKPDFLIYDRFGQNFLKYDCVRIFYTGENERPNFDECDFAFCFDYPVTSKNYRLPLYKLYTEDYELAKSKHLDNENLKPEERLFCNFIYSNKNAKERITFLNMLNKHKNVDSGGKVSNNLGYLVDEKLKFQSNYKFTIAFENTSYPGYTTEKILHAFAAKTIPIYWGNPLIEKDFNPKAFINCHKFRSFDEVIEKIMEIDNDNELFCSYINEPIFPNEKENEFIMEENIFRRFDEIFNNPHIETVSNKSDILKNCYTALRKVKKYSFAVKNIINHAKK